MIERLLAAGLVLALAGSAAALPLYGARSGRTCDNCHSLPNSWYDPPEVERRKCTLSCVSCHVDPNGGGLRNVSGRYFGETTLPMFGERNRPLADQDRDILDWLGGSRGTPGTPQSQPASGPVKAVADRQVDPRPPGAPTPTRGLLAFGHAAGHAAGSTAREMGWLDGRYDDHLADPLLLLGADGRFAYWAAGPLFFPMQADVYAAIHPANHVTASASVGARGRARSIALEGEGLDEQSRFAVKDLWVMVHELPYMAWVRVGRFLPAFGTRVADHTAPIRRGFELSQEDPSTRVIGVEAGLAPNYPYATLSAFTHSTLDANNPVEPGDGWGAALTAGWRDLGWQIGGSAMIRRRALEAGGDRIDVAVHGAWNPWFYWAGLPLTWLGEAGWSTRQRPFSGTETQQLAVYQQLAWTVVNGVVLRGRYDFGDPDLEIVDDHLHRPGLGLDWTFLPGLTLDADFRVGIAGGGEPTKDFFLQLHGWL